MIISLFYFLSIFHNIYHCSSTYTYIYICTFEILLLNFLTIELFLYSAIYLFVYQLDASFYLYGQIRTLDFRSNYDFCRILEPSARQFCLSIIPSIYQFIYPSIYIYLSIYFCNYSLACLSFWV